MRMINNFIFSYLYLKIIALFNNKEADIGEEWDTVFWDRYQYPDTYTKFIVLLSAA